MTDNYEANDLLIGPTIDGVPENEADTGAFDFTDDELGLPKEDLTGQQYKPEEYKENIKQNYSSKEPVVDILKTRGLDKFKSVEDALDAYVNLNSKIGEMATKVERFGELQERNRLLEEQLGKIFTVNENGELYLTDEALTKFVREQKAEYPEKTETDILDELDKDFEGTLYKIIDNRLGNRLTSIENYIQKQQRFEQQQKEYNRQSEEADKLINHYINNVEGFYNNLDKVEKILEDNPELYQLSDPLKIAHQMLKQAGEIATKRKTDDAFVETSRVQPEQNKSEEDADWNDIYSQGTNSASLLKG